MPRATWPGATLAEAPTDAVRIVEGNAYSPPSAVRGEHLRPSARRPICGWKGTASAFDATVAGEVNRDAAWYYPDAKDAAKDIEGWVAFWHGVTVVR